LTVAAMLAAVVGAGVVALLIGIGGSGDQSAGQQASAGGQAAVPPVPVSAAELARLPRATTFTSIAAAPLDQDPFALTGGLVVHPLAAQVLYAGPGERPIAVLPATQLGGPTWVPVVQASPGWDRVLLPSRPNRATGWIFTGWPDSSVFGHALSNGCVRVPARALRVLSGIPLGSLVLITR
jgi:hypothetical protein